MVGITLLGYASAAEAVRITNLDDVPREVTIEHIGEADLVTLAPGESRRVGGISVYIVLDKQAPVRANRREEYIIYKNAVILQRRHTQRNR